ncbi:MAG TPA: adenylate/guanylate cyclase domain-containing protein [Candidatus Limnocylindrales bacterium]|jgi:class 3 adenylate cyclase
MPRLQAKRFADPDQVREMPLVKVKTVGFDDTQVGYCTFEPGWRWSASMGPMLGLTTCPIRHLGYTISGSLHVVMEDGQALDIGPGTVFEIPPGHDKWVTGDEPWVTVEWGGSGRAMGEAMQESRGRTLATVLFTDIVDSTVHLREAGDAVWREQLTAHNARIREQLNVYRGREVKTTGDGVLAVFDSPTRAVRAAVAIASACRDLGIEVRAGLHTGEIEEAGDDVRGIAVHVAARVMALAGPGEVLVTTTTADLTEGSGITLEDAGEHELKGLSGRRRVLRVVGTR